MEILEHEINMASLTPWDDAWLEMATIQLANSIQFNSFILSPCKAWLQYIEIWYNKYVKMASNFSCKPVALSEVNGF